MFLVVRTKDRLKKTKDIFEKTLIKAAYFPISFTKLHKIDIKENDDGFIVTSPNAVLSIPLTKLPFFCVGSATEKESRETGRRIAYTGYEGAKEMAVDIAKKFPPQRLVHAAGDTAETGWYTILEEKNIKVEKRLAYETQYTTKIDEETLKILADPSLKGVLFFSVRGVKEFTTLLSKHNHTPKSLTAIAFSDAIAEACLGYKEVKVCPAPKMEELIKLLKRF